MDIWGLKYNIDADSLEQSVYKNDVSEVDLYMFIATVSGLQFNTITNSQAHEDDISNHVFIIGDSSNMNIVITFSDDNTKDIMYKLYTCKMKTFDNIIKTWFKEYFGNKYCDTFFDIIDIDLFLNELSLEAHNQLVETESKNMEWIVDMLSGARSGDKANEEDKKEEENKDMVKSNIVAIQYGRHNTWGAMDQLGPASVVPETVVECVKPNSVVVGPKTFNDSSIIVTVYITRDLYDEFEKLLNKSDFAVRFANELVELELSKPVDKTSLVSELSRVLRKVVASLNDIIRVQALNNEKNVVLYLKNIKEKTEELIKAMRNNDTAEADEPIPVVENSNPVEPKVEEYRKGKIDMINKHPYSKNMFKPQSILSKVYETGNRIKNDRNISGIFIQAVSEIGELGEEVRIKTDKSYYRKGEGKDGILGEACDVIIAVTDLLNIAGYSLEDIDRVISSKLNKWEHKVNDKKVMVNVVKCDGDVGNFDYVKMYNDVNGKESRVCYIGLNTFLVINYEDGKILGSTVYEGFDKFVEFVKNCNIGDIDNPNMLAKEIVDMLDRKGE